MGEDRAYSTVILGAGAASLAAGLVHAAASGTHSGVSSAVTIFAVTAAVQAILAGAVVLAPTRSTLLFVAGVNTAAVVAWGISRSRGLPWPDALQGRDEVGTQDFVAAALGASSALLAGLALAAPKLKAAKAAPTALAGALCTALLAFAIPGMAATHSHGHDEGDAAGTETAAADGHSHDDGLTQDAATGGGALPTGPVIALDDPRVPAAQREAAQALIDDTTRGMARFTDQAAVEAAGYISIGDAITGFEHFVNYGNLVDGQEMNPDAIESIVLQVAADGTKSVASAMYILSPGKTMDDVPDVAGELTTWHDHQNLCWEGARVVATTDDTGSCPRGEFRGTPPMLHVWMTPNECGPFAGIEGSHGSSCHSH